VHRAHGLELYGESMRKLRGTEVETYSNGTLANATIPVVTDANVSNLVGVQVYAGYGFSEAYMLSNGKYALVYTVH